MVNKPSSAQSDASSPLGDRVLALLQYPLPHRLLSDVVRWATRLQTSWFKNRLIGWIVKKFQVSMDDAEQTNPFAYPSFNAFFTRALRDGARPLARHGIVSPVDGRVSEIGRLEQDRILQAKGHHYSVTQLLAGDTELAGKFANGHFATLYLSPRDYHRVHMPWSGELLQTAHVPGRLFSVAPCTVNNVPGLFARNERLICHFRAQDEEFVVILVGALLVSSMSTVWSGDLKRARRGIVREQFEAKPVSLARGQEMGRFNMGSTVIVLFQRDRLSWVEHLDNGAEVRMGQMIAERMD